MTGRQPQTETDPDVIFHVSSRLPICFMLIYSDVLCGINVNIILIYTQHPCDPQHYNELNTHAHTHTHTHTHSYKTHMHTRPLRFVLQTPPSVSSDVMTGHRSRLMLQTESVLVLVTCCWFFVFLQHLYSPIAATSYYQ